MKQEVIHSFPIQMLDRNYTRVIYYDSGWKATFIFIILPYLSGTRNTYNSSSWLSTTTPSNVLADDMFRFWLHRWKWEHDPLQKHLSKTCRWWLSFQAWCCHWADTLTACPNTQNHCTPLHITASETGAMKGRPTDEAGHYPTLSNRTRLCLSCSRNHANDRRSSTLGFYNYKQRSRTDFKPQIQATEGIFQVQLLSEMTPMVRQMQWWHSAVTPMSPSQ